MLLKRGIWRGYKWTGGRLASFSRTVGGVYIGEAGGIGQTCSCDCLYRGQGIYPCHRLLIFSIGSIVEKFSASN